MEITKNDQTTNRFSTINSFHSTEELHQINYYIPWQKASRLVNEEGIFLKEEEIEKRRKEELEKRQKEKEEREKKKILSSDKAATFWMTHINSGNMYRTFIKNPNPWGRSHAFTQPLQLTRGAVQYYQNAHNDPILN
jgi:hypothetical protein